METIRYLVTSVGNVFNKIERTRCCIDRTHTILCDQSMRMKPHVSWLLTSVIESFYPVGLLSRPSATIQEAFNRPAHRMGPDLLLQTLLHLWQTGYLQCGEREEVTAGTTAPHGRMQPNRACLQAALRHERDLYYAVTLLGAHHWETVARPRWYQFTRLDGDGTTIDGGSRAIVAELLALSQGIRDLLNYYRQNYPNLIRK